MRGTQAILAGLVLLGGVGMLIDMIFLPVGDEVGLISAAVAVASFALMAYSDMRAAGNVGAQRSPPPDDARPQT